MCWQGLRGVGKSLGVPGGTWKCTGPRGIAYICEMPKNKGNPRKKTNKQNCLLPSLTTQVQHLEGEN